MVAKAKLKASIFKFAEDGLVRHLNVSTSEAKRLIKNFNLEKSINRAPDVVAHYSQEQLVYSIIK